MLLSIPATVTLGSGATYPFPDLYPPSRVTKLLAQFAGSGEVRSRPCAVLPPAYTAGVHRFFTPLLRRLYGFLFAFVLVYGVFSLGQYSDWNKERLYRKLVAGDRAQKLSAGFDLAWLGGQEQLLRALRCPSGTVR